MKIKVCNIFFISLLILSSCSTTTIPKPYGYFRIELPKNQYHKVDMDGLYHFEISNFAMLVPPTDINGKTSADNWMDIEYPRWKGRIHLSYKAITRKQFQKISEESRDLAYKHSVRADAINETYYSNDSTRVYGIFYTMTGMSASPAQFFMTDSTRHFLRGALYFMYEPNPDSIGPVNEFVQKDMKHLVETLRWN